MPLTLRRGAENLLRNWITTIPTIVVLALVLTMFHGIIAVYNRAQETIASIEQKLTLTVYLKDAADPFEIGNLVIELENRSDITPPVIFTSKEQAWQLMSKTFSLDNELLKKYQFSLPASLTITPRTPEDTTSIERFLGTKAAHLLKEPLASKNKQKNITSQMIEFIHTVRSGTIRTMALLIIFFLIGGSLLLASTIHLAMSARHKEISIMKLVGASYGTIIAPFVIEGISVGAIAFVFYLLILSILPLGIEGTKLHLNALVFEFAAVLTLSATVSYTTTLLHIHKKSIF